MKAFPLVKDLVTDVSWNYRQNERIAPFTPRAMTAEEQAHGEFRVQQRDVDRSQEMRKCIECFLCQDVCHVLRTHEKHDEFMGPRFMVRYAGLELNPMDAAERLDSVWHDGGIAMCNITKCCTEVCPEHIIITDNAIIPLKERVVSDRFDPILWLARKLLGRSNKRQRRAKEAGLPTLPMAK
jgi:succinate dehydrogenase / fumarate reductase iron-sulfur subunit